MDGNNTQEDINGIPLKNPIGKNRCYINVICNILQALTCVQNILKSSENDPMGILEAIRKVLHSQARIKNVDQIKSRVATY